MWSAAYSLQHSNFISLILEQHSSIVLNIIVNSTFMMKQLATGLQTWIQIR